MQPQPQAQLPCLTEATWNQVKKSRKVPGRMMESQEIFPALSTSLIRIGKIVNFFKYLTWTLKGLPFF